MSKWAIIIPCLLVAVGAGLRNPWIAILLVAGAAAAFGGGVRDGRRSGRSAPRLTQQELGHLHQKSGERGLFAVLVGTAGAALLTLFVTIGAVVLVLYLACMSMTNGHTCIAC
jgi:hypothetical protein